MNRAGINHVFGGAGNIRWLWVWLIGAATGFPASAQSVELEVPTEYRLVENRLAVTFADTVSLASAEAILRERGIEVVSIQFPEVVVFAVRAEALTTEERERLGRLPGVRAVEESEEALRKTMRTGVVGYALRLDPVMPLDEAYRIPGQVQGLTVVSVRKPPNEAVVAVDHADTALLEWLERHPLVEYVAFIHEAE